LTGEAIRAAGAREVWGVERDPRLAEQARLRLDQVITGDISERPLLDLPSGSFDVLIYADVLEHLVDPWSVLDAQRGLLRSGGHAVFSLPNVRHIRVVASLLLQGEWRYTEEGILSMGHLRFFTTRGMRRLITGAGYEILREEANYAPRGVWLRRLSLGLLDDVSAEQRLFVARLM
jgi:SAM-dependent methyltransferase